MLCPKKEFQKVSQKSVFQNGKFQTTIDTPSFCNNIRKVFKKKNAYKAVRLTAWGVNVRIAHFRIAHWGAILRWAILSPSVIRIAHPNYYVFYELFVLDMGPG